jgi:hypothetical protein
MGCHKTLWTLDQGARKSSVRHFAVTVIVLLVASGQAQASSLLLDSFQISGSVGAVSSHEIPLPFTEAFGLTYQEPPGSGPIIPAPCVGCDFVLPLRTTGGFDFDATNSPGFLSLVAQLTDGIDQTLYQGANVADASGQECCGFGSGGPESALLRAQPDLTGRQIDFIRLVILANEVTISGVDSWRISTDVRWEFWGSGTPVPSAPPAIPEPGTFLLVASGALATVARHRKKQGVTDFIER